MSSTLAEKNQDEEYWPLLFILLMVNFTLHFLIILTPGSYLFDEVYYVGAAKNILLTGGERRPEHPPLAQLIITGGVIVFGDNPFGWRFFSILFGSMSIAVFYYLCRELFKSERLAFYGALLLTFQHLFFTFSLLALLDVYYLFFLLLSLYFLARARAAKSAMALALSLVSKLLAVLAIPIFPIYMALTRRSGFREEYLLGFRLRRIGLWFAALAGFTAIFLFIFDQLYSEFSVTLALRGAPTLEASNLRYYVTPWAHLLHMFQTHTSPNWPQVDEPPPWMWFFTSRNYYLGTYSLVGDYFIEGLSLPLIGLAFLSVPYAFYNMVRRRDPASIIAALSFAFSYLSLIPLSFLVTRPLFYFYILAIIPALCIAHVRLLQRAPRALLLYAFLTVAYFMIFQYPVKGIPFLGV